MSLAPSGDNPIPERLRADHLFVLAGYNPLPVWVAARLLLQPGGRLYFVGSAETLSGSRRVAKRLLQLGYQQPTYVNLGDPYDAHQTYDAIAGQLRQISSGRVGLNYTAGTKVMSVHAYRAMEKHIGRGLRGPIFSYLDPTKLQMRFDRTPELPEGHSPVSVGLAPETALTIQELFAFHSEHARLTGAKQQPPALPVAEAIARLHFRADGFEKWRPHSMKLTALGGKVGGQTLEEWPPELAPVRQALFAPAPTARTLDDLHRTRAWPFQSPQHLAAWLDGLWLESYVVDRVSRVAANHALVNDYLLNLKCDFGGWDIQADVAAMRGYQLHFISCYTGKKTDPSTIKLMEAVVRARQIGGDEAGAALVCMSETPEEIEADVRRSLRELHVRVFGRSHLEQLETHLLDWFREGVGTSS